MREKKMHAVLEIRRFFFEGRNIETYSINCINIESYTTNFT